MTDYCKTAAEEINKNVYDCLGCVNLVRTDCPRYESKILEVTNLDFDGFFDENHRYQSLSERAKTEVKE